MKMTFPLAGENREVDAQEREPQVSRSTGSPLRSLLIEFRVPESDEMHEVVTNQLRSAQYADDAPLRGTEGGWWVVARYAPVFDADDNQTFQVELIEIEILDVIEVEFQDQTCSVGWYSDNASEQDAYVAMMVEFDAAPSDVAAVDDAVWRDRGSYFDLVRVTPAGRLDPVQVRFGGKVVWEGLAGGGRRYRVNFVRPPIDGPDEAATARSAFETDRPERVNAQRAIVRLQSGFDVLVGELEAVGALDGIALERIRTALVADLNAISLLAFHETDDVSTYR